MFEIKRNENEKKHRGSRHTGWWDFIILHNIKSINGDYYDIIHNFILPIYKDLLRRNNSYKHELLIIDKVPL